MRMLGLVTEYKPVPSKPAKFVEFYPDMTNLFDVSGAVASLLSPLKAVHKNDPTYNPIFSRLGLSLCATFIILNARKACNVLTYNERKVLKALEESIDFTTVMIPGPYVVFLSTYGFHLPADRRFDAICPALLIDEKEDKPRSTHISPLFPHIPALLKLSHVLTDDSKVTEKKAGKPSSSTAASAGLPQFVYWTNDEFTLVNGHADFDDALSRFNTRLDTKATRDGSLGFLSANCALIPRFHAKRLDLVRSAQSYSGAEIPQLADTSDAAADLLTFFGLKSSTRWVSTVMESLQYEARFFAGSSSLGSIGHETGQNILCTSVFVLKNDAVKQEWFSSIHLDEAEADDESSPHHVETCMENVSDGDMAIANLTQTISRYGNSTGTNPYKNKSSVTRTTNIPRSSVDPYNSHVRRYIRGAPLLSHRFRSHIKTEMMLNLDDVL
jgi:hypothetical protein